MSNKHDSSLRTLIIISAPSGCGKTTIVERLLKRHSNWKSSVSVTTRAPRKNEKEGEDYFFVSSEEFKAMINKNEFLEYAKVHEHYYGTPKSILEKDLKGEEDIVLTIDIQGAKKVIESQGNKYNVLSIFILPPSIRVLRERLENRKTETPEQVERRIQIAQNEIKEAGSYQHSVINKNLEQTILDIENIILKFDKNHKGEN